MFNLLMYREQNKLIVSINSFRSRSNDLQKELANVNQNFTKNVELLQGVSYDVDFFM